MNDKKLVNKTLPPMDSFLVGDTLYWLKHLPDNSIDTIITSPPYWCYAEGHEILTDNGWKDIKDIREGEKVLSINPKTMELEYVSVIATKNWEYSGSMIHFDNTFIDLLVTPNHKMFVYQKTNGRPIKPRENVGYFKNTANYIGKYFVKASEIKSGYVTPKTGFKWRGKNPQYFILPALKTIYNKQERYYPPIKIKIEDWVAFFGIWTAEGSVRGSKGGKKTCYSISMKQKEPNARMIRDLLKKLPFKFSESKSNGIVRFEITDKQLWSYLRNFGNSHTKFIPKEIKELSPRLLQIFLKWYLFGDGSHKKTKKEVSCYTVSERLKDDLQEISLKIGSNISLQDKNRLVFLRRGTVKLKEAMKITNYSGWVYGIEVEKNHTLCIRRNNKIVFSGNSLRDYGKEANKIWNGDSDCEHEWIAHTGKKLRGTNDNKWKESVPSAHLPGGAFCRKCGGWYGQLGLEPTLDMYIEHMLQVTAELKRILKKSGVMFWNMGDNYSTTPPGNRKENWERWSGEGDGLIGGLAKRNSYGSAVIKTQIPQKCMCLQNYRLILRMIDEQGWILRDTIIWAKKIWIAKEDKAVGNAMPSCLDPETEIYIKTNDGVISVCKLKDLLDEDIKHIKILSPTGWKKIKNIWKVKKDEYLEFQFGSSGNVICSLEHRFPVSHDNRRKNYEVKEAKELREDEHKSLDRLLFVPIGRFLNHKHTMFRNQKLDYELGKFIGLIAAEGGFSRFNQFKITLSKNERDLMKWFLRVLQKRFKRTAKISEKNNYIYIQPSSADVKRIYEHICKGKCVTKKLNMTFILNTHLEFRCGLFDGIIDGDGHIDKNGRITYGTASKQLRDDVYLLASSIGLLASKHEYHRLDKRTKKVYDSYFLTVPLSLQKEIIKGERTKNCYWNRRAKKVIPASYKNVFSCKTLKISKIKQVKKEKEFIDIEVEGGLFLINGGLVTHNSVRDRCTFSYEPIFMLVKNKKYYFDLDVLRVPYSQPLNRWGGEKLQAKNKSKWDDGTGQQTYRNRVLRPNPMGANRPNVWQINTEPASFAHFACFPTKLVKWLILAGCPQWICKKCEKPRERIVKKKVELGKSFKDKTADEIKASPTSALRYKQKKIESKTIGWTDCGCNAGWTSGVVLDPFVGAGTTALVAKQLGRHFIGIDINSEYIKIAKKRLAESNFTCNIINKFESVKEE